MHFHVGDGPSLLLAMAERASRLYDVLEVGRCKLQHRIVMSPLTRYRSDGASVPLSFVKDYYRQRASVPGTLLISEATAISSRAVGFLHVPGIWNATQIEAWREITDSVHKQGSFIFLQLWATGRSFEPGEPLPTGFDYASSSPIPIEQGDLHPRELSDAEIHRYIDDYATAAQNAITAGLDGVEIHAANGYLIDQFLQTSCNHRTDRWGGTMEKRANFLLEIVEAVSRVIGADRVGVKLTPWGRIQGMGTMLGLALQFEYVISKLRGMELAYLHLANSRWLDDMPPDAESNERFVNLWNNASPVILEGGYTANLAQEEVDEKWRAYDVAIAFGRYFISNPDLPFRVKMGIDLQGYERDFFYTPMSERGYVDYSFCSQFASSLQV
jgi:2,4-dienoyl-CoA reductase-like NADH-dependent reductase (Old Yellow Enzyme family)